MRPTPAEVIDGVRRILRDVVAPDVAGDYASSRLRAVLAVLGDVDWNDAPLTVLRENEAMRALLERCPDWIPLALPDAEPTGSFEDANRLNGEYRALLERSITSLAAWRREHPDDEAADALWADLVAQLSSSV